RRTRADGPAAHDGEPAARAPPGRARRSGRVCGGAGCEAAPSTPSSTLGARNLPPASPPAVDLRVLAFAIALTVVTGMVFGLAPLLRVGAEADLGGLREGARSGGGQKEGVRSTLVVVEIVASVVLLVSAGLLIRALWNVQQTNPGFRSDSVLRLNTPLPTPQFERVVTRDAFYTRVMANIRALPGVTNVAFV